MRAAGWRDCGLLGLLSEDLFSPDNHMTSSRENGKKKQHAVVLQVGHRDFDVEKKLRTDLRRTRALLADSQLLLAAIDASGSNQPNGSKEQIERLHCQVSRRLRSPPGRTPGRPPVRVRDGHQVCVSSWRRARPGGWRPRRPRRCCRRSWRTPSWSWRTSASRRAW